MCFFVFPFLFGSIYIIGWDVLCFFMNLTFDLILYVSCSFFYFFFSTRNSHRACTPWNCEKMKKTQQIITKGKVFVNIFLILFVCWVDAYAFSNNIHHGCGATIELWMYCLFRDVNTNYDFIKKYVHRNELVVAMFKLFLCKTLNDTHVHK